MEGGGLTKSAPRNRHAHNIAQQLHLDLLCHSFHRDWVPQACSSTWNWACVGAGAENDLSCVQVSTPSEAKILRYGLQPTASCLEVADAVVVEGRVDEACTACCEPDQRLKQIGKKYLFLAYRFVRAFDSCCELDYT
jgi:hypothetical protein